jgi:hypothetical protein
MKRFAVEIRVMRRRLRAAHVFGRELTTGRVRKSSPFAGCAPSQHCGLCEAERTDRAQSRRRERYAARQKIEGELP